MTKAELIAEVAKKAGITKRAAELAVNATFDTIAEVAKQGDTLRIPRFGAFKVVTRKERTARNPRTGEPVKVPQTRLLRFSPSLELRSL
ncbi:HU family DNA-binding protein [Thermodesulfovibrio yellowstonii]|uniref:HU family DNA-binding protein n=1 Tax=Thermodesulfovibrio yellowstonii TaxID=28262 RepID=UPI0004299086|nr:HU family DNA-binding protein [Thermodesulfovibrio islandicus]